MNALLQILLPASLFAAAPVADAMAPQPTTDDARPERARHGDKARKGKDRDHRMRADRGKRGKAMRAERAHGKRGETKRSEHSRAERVEMRFARMDADGSGEVTLAEMMAAEKARRTKRSGKKDRKAKRDDKKRGDKKRGDKQARKSKRGGKKAMTKRGKDRKRFANRGSKNAA